VLLLNEFILLFTESRNFWIHPATLHVCKQKLSRNIFTYLHGAGSFIYSRDSMSFIWNLTVFDTFTVAHLRMVNGCWAPYPSHLSWRTILCQLSIKLLVQYSHSYPPHTWMPSPSATWGFHAVVTGCTSLYFHKLMKWHKPTHDVSAYMICAYQGKWLL